MMITCQFENKDVVSLRHVVTNAIIVRKKRILLEKRGTLNGNKIPEYGKWALVGGYLDRNETLSEGIQREIEEETGWQIKNLKLFRINDSPNRKMEDKQNVDMIFIADAIKQLHQTNEEVTQLKWFKITDLPPTAKLAFDHSDTIELYKRFLVKEFPLPVLG